VLLAWEAKHKSIDFVILFFTSRSWQELFSGSTNLHTNRCASA